MTRSNEKSIIVQSIARKEDFMICTNCGKDLPNEANFCINCGTPIEAYEGQNPDAEIESPIDNTAESSDENEAGFSGFEISNSNYESEPETKLSDAEVSNDSDKKPKKKFPLLKVLIAVVIVAALLPLAAVLGYHTFLPAKLTLAYANFRSSNNIYDVIDKYLSNYENKTLKPLYENSFGKKAELSLTADESLLSGLEYSDLGYLIHGINSISFTTETVTDIKGKKQTANLGINVLDTPFLNLNMFLDGTRFGFSIPELSSKTITGDLKNLSKLSETFPEIPSELLETYESMDPWQFARLQEEISFDRDELKKVLKDYSKVLIQSIDSGDMSIKRGQETQVLGSTLKCHEITIELDQKDQSKILTNILTKLENDNRPYDLVIGNFKKLLDIYGNMYSDLYYGFDAETYLSKENYKNAIKNLKNSINAQDFPEKITARLYLNGYDIVKYEYTLGAADEVIITVEQKVTDLSFDVNYILSAYDGSEFAYFNLRLTGDYDKNSDTTDFTASMDLDAPDAFASIDIKSDESLTSGNVIDHNFMTQFVFDDGYGQGARFVLKMSGNKTRNAQKLVTKSSYNGDLSFNIYGEYIDPVNFGLGFTANTDTEYGKKIELPDLDPSNTLDISTAGQQEYEELMYEVYQNIYTLLMPVGLF